MKKFNWLSRYTIWELHQENVEGNKITYNRLLDTSHRIPCVYNVYVRYNKRTKLPEFKRVRVI